MESDAIIIEQKLEQNEKIIQIFSESLPHLNDNDRNDSPNTSILRLFAKQLYILRECDKNIHSCLFKRYPNLKVWLKILNIGDNSLNSIISKELTFHDLYQKNDVELNNYLKSLEIKELDSNNIKTAFFNLKEYYNDLEKGQSNSTLKPIINKTNPIIDVYYNNPDNTNNTNGLSSIPSSTSTSISTSGSGSTSSILVNNVDSKLKSLNLTSPNTSSSTSAPRQRKSESEINNFLITHSLITPPNIKNPNNQITTNSAQNVKNLTFSPILQKSNKKSGASKVTTPPPFRKLSTGNQFNINNKNTPIQVAAVFAAAQAVNAANNKSGDMSYSNNSVNHSNKNDMEVEDNSSSLGNSSTNIQRSSSHESYSRNKINLNNIPQPPTPQIEQKNQPKYLTTNSVISTSSSSNKSYLASNTNNSLNNITEPSYLDSQNDTFFLNNNKNSYENIRRLSTEGSEYSSKSPSGQASPSLQSPTRTYINKSDNLKSPKLLKDHSWVKNIKVTSCGVCQKKILLFGIKCANCKFVKYIRFKNIKKCDVCNKPLWHGIKCKNCKFRCHKDCEKKCPQNCTNNNLSSLFTKVFPININEENNTNTLNNNLSASSSAIQSPGVLNNSSSSSLAGINDDHQQQTGYPVYKTLKSFANKIADTISTPKQTHKIINNPNLNVSNEQHLNWPGLKIISNNHVESKSSSSCNSSEPNSPNNLKQTQLNQTQNNKKSSTSSIGSSIRSSNQQQPFHIQSQSSNKLTPLTPIQSVGMSSNGNLSPNPSINNQSRSPSATKLSEFFPSKNDLNNTQIGQIDNNNNIKNYNNDNNSRSVSPSRSRILESVEDKTTKEVRNSLKLALTKNTINDYTYNVISNEDEENGNQKPSQNSEENADYDNEDMNRPNGNEQFNISYEEISDKKMIGRGRFGVVYQAYWHGPIAIKEIDFDESLTDDSDQLKNFKEEVFNLRKTRHANLILFVGACVKPPKCAIVMSLCRGISLHKYLHSDSFSKPNIDWVIDIATQIAQGMGYLHNKQMIHKDLRSKNIFIDGCKAVISDFGLFSITKLSKKLKRPDLLPITKECLYYMAPELIRLIGTNQYEFAFSNASDVFAFGTIWYEMLSIIYSINNFSHPFYENAFTSCTESIIYLIGSGCKDLTPNIQIPKEFKVILLKCWSKDPSFRSDFSYLLERFRSIPKRTKLFRSPSHPVHIGRSLETLHNINDMKN